MLDTIFTIGQAACALLILYGASLVLAPVRRSAQCPAAAQEELALRNS